LPRKCEALSTIRKKEKERKKRRKKKKKKTKTLGITSQTEYGNLQNTEEVALPALSSQPAAPSLPWS
jgi:hypothetical protein